MSKAINYNVNTFEELKELFFFAWAIDCESVSQKENADYIANLFNTLDCEERQKAIKWMISNLTAKLEGVPAISTNSKMNALCNAFCKNPHFVCANCYARKGINKYNSLERKLTFNHIILTRISLNWADIPTGWICKQAKYNKFRFQSHGEITNETEMWNYQLFAFACIDLNCAIYSKNLKCITDYFKNHWKNATPNLSVGYSCPIVNPTRDQVDRLLKMLSKLVDKDGTPIIDFLFIVVTDESVFKINCGAKHCGTCDVNCYRARHYRQTSGNIRLVVEKLK